MSWKPTMSICIYIYTYIHVNIYVCIVFVPVLRHVIIMSLLTWPIQERIPHSSALHIRVLMLPFMILGLLVLPCYAYIFNGYSSVRGPGVQDPMQGQPVSEQLVTLGATVQRGPDWRYRVSTARIWYSKGPLANRGFPDPRACSENSAACRGGATWSGLRLRNQQELRVDTCPESYNV